MTAGEDLGRRRGGCQGKRGGGAGRGECSRVKLGLSGDILDWEMKWGGGGRGGGKGEGVQPEPINREHESSDFM